MKFSELCLGQKVRIFNWIAENLDPPDHWSESMEDWIGAVVTIDKIIEPAGVHILEDHHEWLWAPEDFEQYDELSHKNPNVKFGIIKKEERINKVRKAIAADFKKLLKEKSL